MKILFVSMVAFESNTSATIQNKCIVKGLAELNHEVDILTLTPNKSAINYDYSMNDINNLIAKSYYIDINPIYEILMAKKKDSKKTQTNRTTDRRIINKLLKMIRHFIKKTYDRVSIYDAQKYNAKEVAKLNINYDKYDIIISASDPKSSHLIVDRIFKENKNCRAKWIQYWGDPMLIDITRKSDWRDRIVKYEENKLISRADRVIYASPLTLKKQKELFPKYYSKMDYANQAYTDIINNSRNTDRRKEDDILIRVGYFGAYKSTVRNILPLYNAVAKSSNFTLDICGFSDITLNETSNISIHGIVPYHKALRMEIESDILVCICNSKGTQIPGKIYYCSAYKKPIIVILDGEYKKELKAYFNQFNRFILCNNDEESIKTALKVAKAELGKNDYNIAEQLTPKYMAKKILNY